MGLHDENCLDPTEYSDPSAKEFIAAFRGHMSTWSALCISTDDIVEVPSRFTRKGAAWKVVVGFTIIDEEGDSVVLTLRVDCIDGLVSVGRDETSGSLDAPMNSTRHEFAQLLDASPRACADFAAAQIERQLRRRIECHEWEGPGFWHRRWLFADTGEVLIFCDSSNEFRSNLGPPRRVRIVRDFVSPSPEQK